MKLSTDERVEEKLPVYMQVCLLGLLTILQNNNCRMAMTNHMGRSLYDNSYSNHDFLDPRTTFLTRKDFRVDPLQAGKKRRNAGAGAQNSDSNKKRSLTFNQLLAKYGYIEDESMTKKERKREWHVKKVKVDDSDDSDDDFF